MLTLLMLGMFAPMVPATQYQELEPSEIARMASPSIVRVFIGYSANSGGGTGFVVARGGYILTNYHVVRSLVDQDEGPFVLAPEAPVDNLIPAHIIAIWPEVDLALIRADELDLEPLTLAATPTTVGAGSLVYVMGYPGAADRLGPVNVVSFGQGLISRNFEAAWSASGENLSIIQHTAAINPGNSGGPLLNARGHVVGVNTQREVRAISGPMGIPLVSDPIQAVFFSSGMDTAVPLLQEAGLLLQLSYETYAIPGLPKDLNWVAVSIASSILMTLLVMIGAASLRPATAINVIFRCNAAVENCAEKLRRTLASPARKNR